MIMLSLSIQALDVSDHYPIEFTMLPPKFKHSISSLSIAAFNIQIFGRTKSGKDDVMDVLAKVSLYNTSV